MEKLNFLDSFNETTCMDCIGEVEKITIIDNQITYNSAKLVTCATSG